MMEQIKKALEYLGKHLGEDLKVVRIQPNGDNIHIVWEEDGKLYFSLLGLGKDGQMVEMYGGEWE